MPKMPSRGPVLARPGPSSVRNRHAYIDERMDTASAGGRAQLFARAAWSSRPVHTMSARPAFHFLTGGGRSSPLGTSRRPSPERGAAREPPGGPFTHRRGQGSPAPISSSRALPMSEAVWVFTPGIKRPFDAASDTGRGLFREPLSGARSAAAGVNSSGMWP